MASELLKKIVKRTLLTIASILVLLIIVFFIYLQMHKMGPAKEFEINKPTLTKKVCIANQGSKFKNKFGKKLASEIAQSDVYVKVIDISKLKNINFDTYQAVIIINSIEKRSFHSAVNDFLERNKANKNKIIIIATSGSGKWKPDNMDFDTISTASKKNNIPQLINSVVNKIKSILK